MKFIPGGKWKELLGPKWTDKSRQGKSVWFAAEGLMVLERMSPEWKWNW